MKERITCAEFEILLADVLDGTLGAGRKASVESHRAACPACAELAQDAASAMAFIERASEADPPALLVNRILQEAASGPSRAVRGRSGLESFGLGWFREFGNLLQPRFGMGLAMAILSLAMVARFWPAADKGMHRAWDRTVKSYENLQLVYDVQARLQEWGGDDNFRPADNPGGAENK